MNHVNHATWLKRQQAEADRRIRAGEGREAELCLWLADVSAELKLLEQERFQQNQRDPAAMYIRENFQPQDKLAVVLLNQKNKSEIIQRIATAEQAASPKYQAWLRHMNAGPVNEQGIKEPRDVYISMNALREEARGRTKADVASVRHIYLDLDEGGQEAVDRIATAEGMPQPSYVIESSPGKHQMVWKVEGFEKEQAEALQRGLAYEYGADPAATDVNRVMRLPGFRNHKYETAPRVKVLAKGSDNIYRPEQFPEVSLDRYAGSRMPRNGADAGTATQSHRDWAYVLRELDRGVSSEEIKAFLAQFRTDKPRPAYYAEITVNKAIALRSQNPPER